MITSDTTETYINSGCETSINKEDSFDYEDDTLQQPPKDIFCTNEVRSCAELYRMVSENSLNTQPSYQRRVVWNNADRTRFLDSLSKRLPIPSLCISVSNEKYEVIDGQQRIATIVAFLEEAEHPERDWCLSNLNDVDPLLSGKKVSEIRKNIPELYSRIRNNMLPITSVYCDYERNSHLEYIYKIFHRLNTTGSALNNQEIRNCIYFGRFNNLLKILDELSDWEIVLPSVANDDRLKGQERILMFFAFCEQLENYNGRLTTFLNQYMIDHKNDSDMEVNRKKELFIKTLEIAKQIEYTKKSKVIMDAVLYGIAQNIESLIGCDSAFLTARYNLLMTSIEFSSESLSGAIWQRENTLMRFNKSKEIFHVK